MTFHLLLTGYNSDIKCVNKQNINMQLVTTVTCTVEPAYPTQVRIGKVSEWQFVGLESYNKKLICVQRIYRIIDNSGLYRFHCINNIFAI